MGGSSSQNPSTASTPHQQTAKTVYEFIKATRIRRVKINDVVARKVCNPHIKGIDVAFEDISEEPMENAIEELREKLPDVLERCDGDWFRKWSIHNRHKGRFRGSKRKNDLEGTSASGGDEE